MPEQRTPTTEERHRAFAESLSKAERVLVVVRDELYGGSWDELVLDLEARQQRKPYVYRLNARIDEDLSRIAKLREYEQEQAVDLGALLNDLTRGAAEGISL